MGTPGDRRRFENLIESNALQLEEDNQGDDHTDSATAITAPPPTATTTATSMTVISQLPHFNSSFTHFSTPTSLTLKTEPPDESYFTESKYDIKQEVAQLTDLEAPGPSGLQTPKSTHDQTKASDVTTKRTKKPFKIQYTCVVCQKCFQNPNKLAKHQQIHGNSSPFKCEHCKKAFTSKFKLVRHVLIHSDRRPFSCTICERTFHRKDHLKNHVKVHSPCKKVYVCDKPSCKKEYTSLISYKKHLAYHAAEDGALDCLICEKSFKTKEEIFYHLKVHAGSRTVKNPDEKKYSCDHCERKFFTRKDVRRHMVVHTGKRDFLCQFCPQRFGRKDHLVRHIKKSHTSPETGSAVSIKTETPDATSTVTSGMVIKSEVEETSNLSNPESFATNLDLETLLPLENLLAQPSHAPQELTDLGCEVLDVIPDPTVSDPTEEFFESNIILPDNVLNYLAEDSIRENAPLPAFSQIFQPQQPQPTQPHPPQSPR